jgi:hypothetical protein
MKNQQVVSVFIVLRWITRVVGTALVLFMMFMLLSYTFGPEKSMPGKSMFVILALFALGVGLAWKWEALGGLIILAGSMLFFVLNPHVIWPVGPYHLAPVIAILFLMCWFTLHKLRVGTAEYRQKR